VIYRVVALRVARGAALADVLAGTDLVFRGEPEAQRVIVNGEDITDAVATPAVSQAASVIAQRSEVRAFADALQRRLADQGPVVVEGRDAGTVVFPEADCKFYLDASLDVRARRRLGERWARGEAADLGAVREALARRDAADQTRATAPLVRTDDATYVDSSDLTVDEVIELMTREVERVCCTRS
jgi:cytidylate kinase